MTISQPALHMLRASMMGVSKESVILAQESIAQISLTTQTKLPKVVRGGYKQLSAQTAYSNLGFTVGDDIDDLFVGVELAKGWEVRLTDHTMWSDLIDPKGRNRGNMFYKGSFHDRDAFLNLTPRFSIGIAKKAQLGPARELLTIRFNDRAGRGFDVGSFIAISGYEHDAMDHRDYDFVSQTYRQRYQNTYRRVDKFKSELEDNASFALRLWLKDSSDPTAYWNEDVSDRTDLLKQELRGAVARVKGSRRHALVPHN